MLYPAHLSLDHRPARPRPGTPARYLRAGRVRRLPWKWWGRLPWWVHAIPHAALVAFAVILLLPGVVPHGPECQSDFGGFASVADRHAFIDASAVVFGLIAAALLLSALVASAQRRCGRPGMPTVVGVLALGAVTLGGVISPHGRAAFPAEYLMYLDTVGVVSTLGIVLVIQLTAYGIAWWRLRGAVSLCAAQIGAWSTLLLVLPVIMALTYETVTPLCWG